MFFATGDDAKRLEAQIEQEDGQPGVTIPWKTVALGAAIVGYAVVIVDQTVTNWRLLKGLNLFKRSLDSNEQPA